MIVSTKFMYKDVFNLSVHLCMQACLSSSHKKGGGERKKEAYLSFFSLDPFHPSCLVEWKTVRAQLRERERQNKPLFYIKQHCLKCLKSIFCCYCCCCCSGSYKQLLVLPQAVAVVVAAAAAVSHILLLDGNV